MKERMKSSEEIRNDFLDFFAKKGHTIVPSAPLVPMGDPTLLFTNAGMNQFKDIFLGEGKRDYVRACNTQKCLRVSGKHNDLDEVGHDTYHHTFFEMLGNWSFGDYFKREAIRWAWELLVDVWKLDPKRLYATVHAGDEKLGLEPDEEAAQLWKSETDIDPEHILYFGSKDNFWMMGDTGPCGPCSEIHIDLRPDEERAKIPGHKLVNAGHPLVMEIWNLVFIQYNALAPDKLEPLKEKHVDTGMGFERITAILQGKTSNYDTDLFQPILQKIAQLSPLKELKSYSEIELESPEEKEKIRIAMRVVADHIRAIAFAIADGAIPSNIGRGYVIRRILRRAVRYGYQFLQLKEPFLYKLVEPLAQKMGGQFPELRRYQRSIEKITASEEESFLKTLEGGLKIFYTFTPYLSALKEGEDPEKVAEQLASDHQAVDILHKAYRDFKREEILQKFIETAKKGQLSGEIGFLLHDTYGFPRDLTEIICRENGLSLDGERFQQLMAQQKERARAASQFKAETSQNKEWNWLSNERESQFLGYQTTKVDGAKLIAYRKVRDKSGREFFDLVLDRTPFYAESGGQVGDTGELAVNSHKIRVLDTQKEGSLIFHRTEALPPELDAPLTARVDEEKRIRTAKHHSATHLLHAALRKVLGPHVQQQGSLVEPGRLRFDFSHFEKVSPSELKDIELLINSKIQENIQREIQEDVPLEEALSRGAMALFGEKYGEKVRVVIFDPEFSIELCGGTHVGATGEIGVFKFVSEGAIASGIRRVEAIVGMDATQLIQKAFSSLESIRTKLNLAPEIPPEEEIAKLLEETKKLEKQLQKIRFESLLTKARAAISAPKDAGTFKLAVATFDNVEANTLRELAQAVRRELPENILLLLGGKGDSKAYIAAAVPDALIKKGLKAGSIVGKLGREIGGGGGGRPQVATAGGKHPEKLEATFERAPLLIAELIQK